LYFWWMGSRPWFLYTRFFLLEVVGSTSWWWQLKITFQAWFWFATNCPKMIHHIFFNLHWRPHVWSRVEGKFVTWKVIIQPIQITFCNLRRTRHEYGKCLGHLWSICIKIIHKVSMSSPYLWASFHPLPPLLVVSAK
jgi:hypothetical protein